MPDSGISLLQTAATLLAGLALFRFWRAVAARGVGVGVIAAGFALRALGGAAAFLVSWLELPVARSLQVGNGLWFYAIDARGYAGNADAWILGGAGDVVLPDRSLASYFFVQLVAVCRSLFGPVHSASLLINLFAYLGAAYVIVSWIGSGDARRERIGIATLAAMALMPSWILWSLQPLKDTLFIAVVLLFLFGSDRWLNLWRGGEPRGAALLGAAAVCWLALHAIGGVRWYYACLAWMLWLPAVAWGGLELRQHRARFWLASLLLFGILAQAVALNLPVDLAQGNRRLLDVPTWLAGEVDESRARFVTKYKATTTIAAGPLLEDVPYGEVAARAAMVVLPRFVAMPLGIAKVGGGRGLWLFAEVDTIAFVAVALYAIGVAWRARSRRLALDGTLVLALALIAVTLPMLWAVNNFGTLLRFREMFMIPLLVVPLVAASQLHLDASR
ncbi:MAG: hypothetical protein NDJ92_02765 [Thermoanaerobaculia bacterium]|nr:hypothetical protein [Thermoanaerobaculia bacterium]